MPLGYLNEVLWSPWGLAVFPMRLKVLAGVLGLAYGDRGRPNRIANNGTAIVPTSTLFSTFLIVYIHD
jgi:hypothetical protein